jgi:hypothetical protein
MQLFSSCMSKSMLGLSAVMVQILTWDLQPDVWTGSGALSAAVMGHSMKMSILTPMQCQNVPGSLPPLPYTHSFVTWSFSLRSSFVYLLLYFMSNRVSIPVRVNMSFPFPTHLDRLCGEPSL